MSKTFVIYDNFPTMLNIATSFTKKYAGKLNIDFKKRTYTINTADVTFVMITKFDAYRLSKSKNIKCVTIDEFKRRYEL